MEVTQVPPLALVAFGLAFASALAMFGCLHLLTQRLGVAWKRHGLNWSLESRERKRVMTLILAGPERLSAAGVTNLVWAVRVLWLTMMAGVATFAFLLTEVA